MRVALSISGSDPTGGAGLQLDLQVFRSLGVHGTGVPTALTIQDTAKVHSVLPIFPSVLIDQIRTLLSDISPHAVKIGMLASDDVARAVSLSLAKLNDPAPPIVVDPVLYSTSGTALLERRGWRTLMDLIGRSTLVTPNLPEAESLIGCDISTEKGLRYAVRAFVQDLGAKAALLKGGHRVGPPDDLLATYEPSGVKIVRLPALRIAGAPVHGTGCALASASAALLAKGMSIEDAVRGARKFVHTAIEKAEIVGNGARLLGLEQDAHKT